MSIEEQALKLLEDLEKLATKCRSENIPFVDKSFGPEWDSLFEDLMEVVESNQDLNGLTDRLTQNDIETIEDEEFKHYGYAVPMYKTFTFKFIDLLLIVCQEDEDFVNRTKVILEQLKKKYH